MGRKIIAAPLFRPEEFEKLDSGRRVSFDATAAGYEIEKLTLAYCGFTPHTCPARRTAAIASCSTSPAGRGKRSPTVSVRWLARAASVAALEEVMLPKLREAQMEELFYKDRALMLCAVLAKMENEGLLPTRRRCEPSARVLRAASTALREAVWARRRGVNSTSSPRSSSAPCFLKSSVSPGGKKTKTGWSTNADVLDKLRYEPVVRHVLEYRELTKLKSTYADGLLKVIGADGRIHTNFQMTVTATGRLSSTEPNLQNIPVRRELWAGLRKMFVAAPGNVLVDADYSQIELRLLAHISGDEAMRAAFLSGEDVHRVTAQVFGVS